ncbi:MAG TPA: 23S rRNA (uracil(1939)-C(5))-methyltransferase RlmD [Candidatus Acidoferrales bacterium]|nr:23S rRNA (uracil(1939)-C(5))-methyltransferase RlmD [Candidatus Acidoferrales bacterium]
MTKNAPKQSAPPVRIQSLSYGRYGVGRQGGRVVLVELTAPGDEAEIKIIEERKNYATAELVRLVRPSAQRQDPPCRYFPACGGCPWQHIAYRHQLAAKEDAVREALRRIGGISEPPLAPIVASPGEYHYRRRVRLQRDAAGRVGFHRAASREVVEIEHCLIADPELNRRLAGARLWAGLLATAVKTIEIVRGDRGSRTVFVGTAAGRFVAADERVSTRWLAAHPEVSGIVLRGPGWRRAWGEIKVSIATADDLALAVDADVFSQVNPVVSQALAQTLVRWGDFQKSDRVLELYCGAGNFTLPVARRAGCVYAVERDRLALENARANARLHGLQNIEWIGGDVHEVAARLDRERQVFSRLVLDPPRAGAKDIDLSRLGADTILYVSCDPATLARDLAALQRSGYALARVQPFDLFPQTFHVEVLAEIKRAAA